MFKNHCFIICVKDDLIGPQFVECVKVIASLLLVKNSLIGPQVDECLKIIASLFIVIYC